METMEYFQLDKNHADNGQEAGNLFRMAYILCMSLTFDHKVNIPS